MGAKTKANVFIIESLDWEDEKDERLEGDILYRTLRMAGKDPIYYYIRTLSELNEVMRFFTESGYRYLHVSCHADENSIDLTVDKNIRFAKLARILGPGLREKRLFLSACSATVSELAEPLVRNHQCNSVVGPVKPIHFDDAAVLWASFYQLMFNEEYRRMLRQPIKNQLATLATLYKVPLRMYHRDGAKGCKHEDFEPYDIRRLLKETGKLLKDFE